jgi:translocation and assembly module TamB
VDYSEQRLKLERARIDSNFSITPSRLHLTSIKSALLGGELSGEVDIINWQSSDVPHTRRRRDIGRVPEGAMQRGSARLEFTRFPLAPGLAIVSSQKLPLDRMRFNGAVSGNLEMAWIGNIRDTEARLNLRISPPSREVAGEIPLRAQMRGVYRGSSDELRVDELKVNTPASEITATGDVARTSSFKFSFSSHNMNEWQPLLRSLFDEEPPFSIRGFAVLNGTANGQLNAFQFNGRLEAYDFDTLLPGDANNPNRTIHWDSLTTGLQYSTRGIAARNGTLIHGSTIAHFDASTVLAKGATARNGPFTLHVDARHADLAEVANLAGLKFSVKGIADVTLNASGTPNSPHGDGHIDIHNAALQGVTIASAKADLRLSGGEVQVNNLDAAVRGSVLTGSGAFNPDTKTFRANLAAKNVDLATIPQLQRPRLKTEGHADITLTASGTREHPTGNAHVHIRDLTLDSERVGDFYIDAQTQGQLIAIQGKSEFEKAQLNIKGTLNPDGDVPADFDLTFDQLDTDAILRLYLGKGITSHAIMAGNVSLHGPLRNPQDLKVLLNVTSIEGEVEHVALRNAEPVRIELADKTVRVESFHITGGGTDLTAHGTATLGQVRALDLRVDGTANVALLPLPLLNPSLSARGMLTVNVGVAGNFTNPVLEGKLDIKDASVNYDDLPTGLSELNGILLFDQNRIQIQALTGKTGGGQVALTGSAYLQNGLVNFDVGAQAQEIRLRYPPGVSATATASLQLTGNSSAAMVSGDVLVTKLAVMPGFDFGAYLERSKLQITNIASDTLESHVRMDVHVTTTPELQMQTAIARLSGDADLHLRGTVDRPVITGRAGRLEGEVYFNGTKFRVDRGEIAFTNPARTQPFVDLQASTRVRDYDITINVAGDVSKGSKGVNVTWRSEPPLPEADIIALLAMGRTREEAAAMGGQGSAGFNGEFSNMLLGEAINSTVGSRVQRLFGVSRLKIDPQGLLSTTNVVRGPQITVEQQVTSNVTITYSTNVAVAAQQIIQLEYNITRNISIVALRDQNGVVSFDFKIRQRKR